VPETEIILAAVTGTTDYARFPKRPRVTVTFSQPAEGGYRIGEDHGEFAARLLSEIRAVAPISPAGRKARV
jgi:1-acyl-sn-glycerol-3-phosphate acyltransferase